jgi:hypothetical protein
MSRFRILPPNDQLQAMVESGMTHKEIAEKIHAETGYPVARSTVTAALARAGISKPQPRYRQEIPWVVGDIHTMEYPIVMLRALGRRRAGLPMTDRDSRRLDSWLEKLTQDSLIVAYCPDTVPGCHYVPGEWTEDGLPILPIALKEDDFEIV